MESQHFTAGRLITAPTLATEHLTYKLEFCGRTQFAPTAETIPGKNNRVTIQERHARIAVKRAALQTGIPRAGFLPQLSIINSTLLAEKMIFTEKSRLTAGFLSVIQ